MEDGCFGVVVRCTILNNVRSLYTMSSEVRMWSAQFSLNKSFGTRVFANGSFSTNLESDLESEDAEEQVDQEKGEDEEK